MSMSFDLKNCFKKGDEDFEFEWNEYLDELVHSYDINVDTFDIFNDYEIEIWYYNNDLKKLFNDFGIEVGKVVYASKKSEYDEGDLIKIVELHQNGKTYLCDAYFVTNTETEYALALLEIM